MIYITLVEPIPAMLLAMMCGLCDFGGSNKCYASNTVTMIYYLCNFYEPINDVLLKMICDLINDGTDEMLCFYQCHEIHVILVKLI